MVNTSLTLSLVSISLTLTLISCALSSFLFIRCPWMSSISIGDDTGGGGRVGH